MKIVIILVVLIALLGGGLYGAAKFGVIPVKKLAQDKPAVGKLLVKLKLVTPKDLVKPKKPVAKVAAKPAAPKKSAPKPAKKKPAPVAETPKETGVDRLARIYSQLEPKDVAPLLEKMNDREVMALLEKMPDDQVGELLLKLPQPRAVTLSRQIARNKRK